MRQRCSYEGCDQPAVLRVVFSVVQAETYICEEHIDTPRGLAFVRGLGADTIVCERPGEREFDD